MADPYVGAARAALGQGLGLGWGDEAEAWLRSKMGQGSYEDQLKQIRGEYGEYSKENPITAGALEFTGGVAPGVAMMMLPGGQVAGARQIGQSGLRQVAKLAGLGGATGAIAGAGAAEEGRRGSGAVTGGVVGTVLGGGAPVVLRGAGAGLKHLRDKWFPSESVIASRAAEKMTNAMRESNLTPQQVERAVAQDASMGVPGMVANVDPALADLAEAVAQRTGRGTRNIEQRIAEQKLGARERTHQQVVKGLKPGNFYEDEAKLVEDLRKKAGSVYDTAYARGSVDDPLINQVLKNPEFQKFYGEAQKIAKTEELAAKLRGEDPSKYRLQDVYKLGKDAEGNVIIESTSVPDVRTLDYIKRGMDATIDKGFRGEGMSTAEASALRDLRKQFVNRLDDLVPEYKAARKTYAGDIEVIDAMRTGYKDFNKLDHEQVLKMVAGMGDAEKEALRTGVARHLYDKIMAPSGNFNAAQRVIGAPEMQAKLQPLFDNPGHFNLFKTALEREAQLFGQANKILGGSQTGKRIQMREDLESGTGVGEAIGQAVTGGFWSSMSNLAARALRNTKMTEETANKLSGMLTAKDPHEVAAVVKLLEKYADEAAPKAMRAGAVERGAVTGTTSAIWPSPEAPSSKVEGEAPISIESEFDPELHKSLLSD